MFLLYARKLLILAAVTWVASVTGGCATAYTPRRSSRLAITMSGGDLSFRKNGRTRELSFLGQNLSKIVKGNAGAVEHAETYEGLRIGSFVLSVVGGSTVGAGGAIVFLNEQNDGGPTLNVVGLGMALGGIAVALTGVFLQLEAQTHLYDAVNIYNDGEGEAEAYDSPPREYRAVARTHGLVLHVPQSGTVSPTSDER